MITGLNHITLAVQDIERSFIFYRDVLGFKPLCKWEGCAYFLIGEAETAIWFCLDRDQNRIATPCTTHYAFSVQPDDFETLSTRIKLSGIIIYKNNTSFGDSLYFLDPDGHKLEIHVGSWQTRITAKKENPGSWINAEWFI